MQLALLFAQNSSLSNLRHCALSNIPTVSCGHVSFNSIQVPQHVLTFKLMGFVLLQVEQQEQPSLHIISSSARSKIIRYESEKSRRELFSLFTEDLQKNMLSLDSNN